MEGSFKRWNPLYGSTISSYHEILARDIGYWIGSIDDSFYYGPFNKVSTDWTVLASYCLRKTNRPVGLIPNGQVEVASGGSSSIQQRPAL